MIIKIFKLHPPCHASRFPFPAGIDSLAGIKKGKKKKKRRYCLRNQFPVVRNFHPTYTINRCSKTAALVCSFVSHLFSNFFFYFLPPFVSISMPRGQKKKKKKSCLVIAKKVEDNRGKVFAQFSPPRRAIGQNRREGKLLLFFLWSDSSWMRWIFHSTGNGRRGEERKEARDRSEFRSRCTEGNKLRPLGDFSDPSRTRRCLSWWGIKMDCIFYENLLLRRGAQRLS